MLSTFSIPLMHYFHKTLFFLFQKLKAPTNQDLENLLQDLEEDMENDMGELLFWIVHVDQLIKFGVERFPLN